MKPFVKTAIAILAAGLSVAASAAKGNRNGRNPRNQGSGGREHKAKPIVYDKVAPGFPDWRGFETVIASKRDFRPSDLRGRFVVVATFESKKPSAQFLKLTGLVNLGLVIKWSGNDWNFDRKRSDTVVLFNMRGGTAADVKSLLDDADCARAFNYAPTAVYSGLTFEGAPDSGGKYPFVYVMPPEGMEPVFAGQFDDKTVANARKAIAAARAKLPPWRDYYGYAGEVKHVRGYDAAVSGGKSFASIEMNLKKAIAGKNPEAAREAQMLFDAINQKKGDLFYRMSMAWRECPLAALYDFDEFSRRWPSAKKEAAAFEAKAQSQPDAKQVYKAYATYIKYSDEGWTPASAQEASKAVAELKRAKPAIDKYTESKNINIQNACFTMQRGIDTLIEEIPSRVK